ncbi:insulinase family protein [Bifidobacterium sp.]|jgi:predicted Zn-dependent peptidase|uniref:insulinase family protein n=1 Tax=Bifidobacterium sp. TaxID=41200 RepID=UPI0025C36947|nr:insulinase family protein [Bifidobacterium sp.]MCH4208957.1 insulinase family protein [Bifidobacterium sp.]MCI1224960.1 insulinase family protein [Bifidobacterium sp.]
MYLRTQKTQSSGVAGLCVKFHRGANLDPKDKIGVTHLVEHILLHASSPYLDNIRTANGEFQGETTRSETSFILLCPSEVFKSCAENFLNEIFFFHPSKKDLEDEKSTVIQEIREYSHDSISVFINEALALAFDERQGHDPIMGDSHTVSSFSLDDVFSSLKELRKVQNAVCYAVGDDVEFLHKYVEKINTNIILSFGNKEEGLVSPMFHALSTEQKKSSDPTISSISFIFPLPDIASRDIIATSMLLTLLTTNRGFNLKGELRSVVDGIYDIIVRPLLYGDKCFIQILTNVGGKSASNFVTMLQQKLRSLSNFPASELEALAETQYQYVHFRQSLLFDGVQKSIRSFSHMPEKQESIIELPSHLDIHIKANFIELVRSIGEEKNSVYTVQQ